MKNIGDLQTHLQARIEQENEAIEKRMQSAYDDLSATLSEQLQSVISTTRNDTDSLVVEWRRVLRTIKNDFSEILTETQKQNQQNQALRKQQKRAWVQSALIGLILWASICLGSWGLTRYLAHTIRTQLRQRVAIAKQITQEQKILRLLKDQAWGVTLHQDGHGRFVVLPRGAKIDTTWTWNKRPAIKFWRK